MKRTSLKKEISERFPWPPRFIGREEELLKEIVRLKNKIAVLKETISGFTGKPT